MCHIVLYNITQDIPDVKECVCRLIKSRQSRVIRADLRFQAQAKMQNNRIIK